MNSEDRRDVVLACILAAAIIGVVLSIGSCVSRSNSLRVECIKAGASALECKQVVTN